MAVYKASVGLTDNILAVDAYTVYLTNEAEIVSADSAGLVPLLTSVDGTFIVLLGTQDVSASTTYTVVSATGIDISNVTIDATGAYALDVAGNALNTTTSVVLSAAHNGTTHLQTLSITRSDAAIDGTSAKSIRLSANRQTFGFNDSALATVSLDGDVTITAYKQNTASNVAWTFLNDKGNAPLVGTSSVLGSATALVQASAFGSNGGAGVDDQVLSVAVTATVDGLSDTITIYKITQGDSLSVSKTGDTSTVVSSNGDTVSVVDGDTGPAGADGPTGQRGSRQFVATTAFINSALGGSSLGETENPTFPWQGTADISATATQGLRVSNWVKNNSSGYDGTLVLLDTVTVYNTVNQWSVTRFYDGTNWIRLEEVIDGNLLVSGTVASDKIVANAITADKIATNAITADKVAADAITADKIVMDGNIEFANTSSGVQFGKQALGDTTAGAFFGRSGGIAGFNISSANSGIYADSSGTVALNNVRLYTGAAGSAAEYTLPGTYTSNISAQSTSISVVIVGGGGGSCNAGVNNPPYGRIAGASGTSSWVKWYSGLNGTGSVLATYTASGGAGTPAGSVASNRSSASGYAGQASSLAAGGSGGTYRSSPAGNGTLGSGGGGPAGSDTYNGSANAPVNVSAAAGSTVSQLINKPSGAQSVKMFVGTGGAGGQGYSEFIGGNDNIQGANVAAGGNGGNGFVSIADPNSGGIEVDLLSIINRLNAAGI